MEPEEFAIVSIEAAPPDETPHEPDLVESTEAVAAG